MSQLISDIIKKLFYGDARLVIVTNRDGFVWSHRREIESEYGMPVRIFAGKRPRDVVFWPYRRLPRRSLRQRNLP